MTTFLDHKITISPNHITTPLDHMATQLDLMINLVTTPLDHMTTQTDHMTDHMTLLTSSSAGNRKRYGCFYGSATLDTFLHNGRAAVAGHHVETWFE